MRNRASVLLLLPLLAASALSCSANGGDAESSEYPAARTMDEVNPCTILSEKRLEKLLSASSLGESDRSGYESCSWDSVKDRDGKDYATLVIAKSTADPYGEPVKIAGVKAVMSGDSESTDCEVGVHLDPSYDGPVLQISIVTWNTKGICGPAKRIATEAYLKLPGTEPAKP